MIVSSHSPDSNINVADVCSDSDLVVTEEDLIEAKAIAATMTLEDTRDVSLFAVYTGPFTHHEI